MVEKRKILIFPLKAFENVSFEDEKMRKTNKGK
jgi:hypothetical protein